MDIHSGVRLRALWIAIAACVVVLALSPAVVRSAASFGPNVRLSDGLDATNERKPVAVADASGNVYAAWGQNHDGDADLYFAASSDGGLTWGTPKRIGGNPPPGSTQDRPAMALGPEGEIVLVWQDDRLTYFDFDIYASVSLDRGGNFSPPVRASDGLPGTLQLAPTVAVDGSGRIAVAWQDYRSGNGDIRAATALLDTMVFGPSVRVDDDAGTGTSAAPSIAVDGAGTIYVAYHDNRSGSANVYLAKSADAGSSFGTSVRVDDTGEASSAQGLVSIATDGVGRIYAVWEDSRAGEVETDGRPIFDVYYARSADGGLSFSKNLRIDDGPRKTSQEAPRIAVGAAGTIYVVWDDARNSDWDPYLTYSTNGGTTFAPNVRLDDAGDSPTDPPLQYSPQIVESRTGLVFALWEDARGATFDIYGVTGYLNVGSALRVTVQLDADAAWPGDAVPFTIRVTSNGSAVDGASIGLSATSSGGFGMIQRTGAGTYRSSFTSSPSTPDGTDVLITASAQAAGYVQGASQALLHVRKAIVVSAEPMWDLLAVGQTMAVQVRASVHGLPLADAAAAALASAGGAVSPASGTTDAQGLWSSFLTAQDGSGGSNVTVTLTVSQAGFAPGAARATIPILAQPRPVQALETSATRELMSRERARIRIDLTSGGMGVSRAAVAPFCVRGGNFSGAAEPAAGVYVFQWEAPEVTSPTWVSIAVRTQRGGYADASMRLAILVDPNMTKPADPTQLFLVVLPEATVVQGGRTISIAVYLFTVQGYAVAGTSISVTVAGGLGAVTKPLDELNGKYTFAYTAPRVATNTGVLLRIDANKLGYATGSVRIALILIP